MSMKAIREALDYLENYLDSNDAAQDARRRARVEVEAIEKAAKDWWEAENIRGRGMLARDSAATLDAIARDAP